MPTPYYAKGETGRAFMTVAESTAAPAAGNSIEIFVDDYSVADVGDYIVFKNLGFFRVDFLVGDGRRLVATNQDVATGTAIPAGTKVFVDLGQYSPGGATVPQPDFNTPTVNGNEITITWNTAPAWVQIQYWKYSDIGTAEFKLARGIDGVIKFKVPWNEATYLRGWGIDINENRSDEVDLGYVSAAIPTPTGVTVTPGSGTLTVEWDHTGYETWVQVWRKNIDDFRDQDIEPLDALGNQQNSVTFTELPAGNYYVRVYHHNSIDWSQLWWSDNGTKDGTGPGWAVTSSHVDTSVTTPSWLPLEADEDELIVKWDVSSGVDYPQFVQIQFWKYGEVSSNQFAQAIGATGEIRVKTPWKGLTYVRGWGVSGSGYYDSDAGTDLGNISVGIPAPTGVSVNVATPGQLTVSWDHIALFTWAQIWKKNTQEYVSEWTWAYEEGTGTQVNSLTFKNLPAGDYYIRLYHHAQVGGPFGDIWWSDGSGRASSGDPATGSADGTGPGYAVAAVTAPGVNVTEPVVTALTVTGQKMRAEWNTTGAPAYVAIQFYQASDWSNERMYTVDGSRGFIEFIVPWDGSTVVRGWGIDEVGNWSDEVSWGSDTPTAVPTPSGVVITPMPSGEHGTLRVSWTDPGVDYHTWVQIWRRGIEDYISTEVAPRDQLGNVVNSVDFVNLRSGWNAAGTGYHVRLYHFIKYSNPQKWSDILYRDNGANDGSGNGFNVTEIISSGDNTAGALEVGVSIDTGGIDFTGSQGFIKKGLSGFATPTASPGFFLGISTGNPGFLIGNTSRYMRYDGGSGALEIYSGTITGSTIVGGSLSIGSGVNLSEVNSDRIRFGGSSGFTVDKQTAAGGDYIQATWYSSSSGIRVLSFPDTIGRSSQIVLNDSSGGYISLSSLGSSQSQSLYLSHADSPDEGIMLRITGTSAYLDIDSSGSNYIKLGGVQVLGERITTWSAPTGTATRTSFATSTVTLEELAQAVKAIVDDLTIHGLIG